MLVMGAGQRFSFYWQRSLGISFPPFIPFLWDRKLSWSRLQVTSTGGWLEVHSSVILLTRLKIMWIWCLGVLVWVEQKNVLCVTKWQYRLLPLLLPLAGIEYTGDGWEVARDGNHILCTRGLWLVSEVFRHLPVTALDMNCAHDSLYSPILTWYQSESFQDRMGSKWGSVSFGSQKDNGGSHLSTG